MSQKEVQSDSPKGGKRILTWTQLKKGIWDGSVFCPYRMRLGGPISMKSLCGPLCRIGEAIAVHPEGQEYATLPCRLYAVASPDPWLQEFTICAACAPDRREIFTDDYLEEVRKWRGWSRDEVFVINL